MNCEIPGLPNVLRGGEMGGEIEWMCAAPCV